ncbi:MAG: hypothetical protein IJT12_05440, partial [Paludibacteraceae bacterium]|nr:hypothetical protein [Paludibacteraceae bacterium]
YTFFRWEDDEDGNFSNPRVVSIDLENTEQTYTALFLPCTDTEVTAWSTSGLTVNTESLNLGGSTTKIYTTDGTQLASTAISVADYGEYNISAGSTDLSAHAGDTLRIVYFCEAGTRALWQTDAVVPVIVSGTKAVSELSLPDNIATTGIHVLNGGKLTFDQNLAFGALTIYAGGKAVVPSGKTVSASSVTMRGDGLSDLFPQLVVNGSLSNTNSDTVYYDYTLDYHAYYPLAVPYTVDHNAIRTRFGRTASFEIGDYDGSLRSTGASGWGGVFDDAHNDIPAAEGFTVFAVPRKWNGVRPAKTVVRFPMRANLSAGESQKTVSVSTYGDENTAVNDRNWNFIGNPYLADFTNLGNDLMSDEGVNVSVGMFEQTLVDGVWNGQWQYTGDLRYVTIPSDGFTSYTQEPVTTALLRSYNSFFVQAANNGYLSFELGHRAQNAPKRSNAAQEHQTAEELSAGITLSQGNSLDHAGLLIGNDFTGRYDYNADLVKLFGSNQGLSVYMLDCDDAQNPTAQVPHAYLALPALLQGGAPSTAVAGASVREQIIPVGYSGAKSEDMTFDYDAMRYNFLTAHNGTEITAGNNARIVAMLLHDNHTGEVTDLLTASYTCRAIANSDDTRFTLTVRYLYPDDGNGQLDVTTGTAETTTQSGNDGQITGNTGSDLYDVLGRKIATGENVSNLPTGVYIVVDNGDARKEVVQ